MDWLRYANQGATRNLPLSPELVNVLSFLPEMGLTAEVISGGQHHKGSGKPRVGSVRHDGGGAGDIRFYQGDRLLDFTSAADQKIGADIVRRAREGGATGMGWGVDYMGPNTMHIGFGTPAVWGAKGKSANVAPWFRDAYYGATQAAAPQMMAQNTKGPSMANSTPGQPIMASQGTGPTMAGGSGNDRMKSFAGLSPEAWMAISGALMNMSSPGSGNPQLSAAYGMLGDKRAKTKADEEKNRTAAWLRSQGREDLAAAMEAGVPGNVVLGQFYKKPTKANIMEVGGRLVNAETGEIVYDGTGGVGLDKDKLSAMNTIRDDVRTDMQAYELSRSGFENIQAFYRNPGKVSDYALAVGFAKILDPGSVVREGEVAAVRKNSTISDDLKQQILAAFDPNSGGLPESVRREIATLAGEMYNQRATDAMSTLDRYKSFASDGGLPTEHVYMGKDPYFYEGTPAGGLVRPPAGRAGRRPQAQVSPDLEAAIAKLSPQQVQELRNLPNKNMATLVEYLRRAGVLK